MSPNNNFAFMFKKEKCYLAWYHQTTSQWLHACD